MAEKLNAGIFTEDENLANIAELKNIKIIDIHKLYKSTFVIIRYNETFRIDIERMGEHKDQGIAYLSDGTMVVVEKAAKYVGQEVRVYVNQISSVNSNRIIFGTVYKEKKE